MNNLLQFLSRYSAFILFVLLECAALYLVIRYNEGQREIFLHSSNIMSGKIYKAADDFYRYNSLSKISDSLAVENASLKARVFNLERSLQQYTPPEKSVDSCIAQTYSLIAATVISNSVNQRNNHFTIDKGYQHGVRRGMGVITATGIAGIIDHVDNQYATAISILHSASRVSASIKRNNYFGSLEWKEINPANMILEAVPRQADVHIGDTIVTSGYSFKFPYGVFIGTVEKFWTPGGSNYYSIDVKLHEDIARLNRVYVVVSDEVNLPVE